MIRYSVVWAQLIVARDVSGLRKRRAQSINSCSECERDSQQTPATTFHFIIGPITRGDGGVILFITFSPENRAYICAQHIYK